jgi:GNAT superfamily N-acetyltransferase
MTASDIPPPAAPAGIRIRAGLASDEDAIVAMNQLLARETEHKQLDENVLRAGVRAALRNPALARYFVACMGDRVIGQLMHTWEWSDWRNGHIWWLQSVYVMQEHRNLGIFRRLFETVLQEAEGDPRVVGIRLYVEHANDAALQVYQQLGMVPASYQVLERIWRRA